MQFPVELLQPDLGVAQCLDSEHDIATATAAEAAAGGGNGVGLKGERIGASPRAVGQ